MLGTTDDNEPLQAMMKDQFGNYVVQKVLETCNDQQRQLILSRIKVHLSVLKKYTYGKHIVARVEKLLAAGGICKLRCFPPVAIVWDSVSAVHITPNLYSETITVDSAPAMWNSNIGSDKTTMLLLVDPHCSYKVSFSVSLSAAASRFCLLYSSQILGFMIPVTFFSLMRQARAWELDLTMPSVLTAVESNMRMPFPFFLLVILPIVLSAFLSLFTVKTLPPIMSYLCVSVLCYLIANGCVIVLILSSQLVLHIAAILHVFIKRRLQAWEDNFCIMFLHHILDLSSTFYSLKIVQIIRGSPRLVVAFITIPLVCFVHSALGLIILLLFHALYCHFALCSFLAASFRSHSQRSELTNSKENGNSVISVHSRANAPFIPLLPRDDSDSASPTSRSFGDSQLEIFCYQHGILMLHLLAALMFMPSLVAWFQRIGVGQSFPWFIDSAICIGIIIHALCGSKPEIISFTVPFLPNGEVGPSLLYLISGYYSFLSALSSTPYKSLYAMSAIGVVSFAFFVTDRKNLEKGDGYSRNSRRHSHRH